MARGAGRQAERCRPTRLLTAVVGSTAILAVGVQLAGIAADAASAWLLPRSAAAPSPPLLLRPPQRLLRLRREALGGGSSGEEGGKSSEKEGQPEEAAPRERKGLDFGEMREIIKEGSWLNPARGFQRRSLVEMAARVGEVGAIGTTAVTGLEKLGMVARAADGLTPLDDSVVFEQSGRLVPLVSGMLWPAAQLSLLILWAFAIAIFLIEDFQRDSLRAIDVDIDTQRRRRINAVALFTASVLLMVSPPIPGLDG